MKRKTLNWGFGVCLLALLVRAAWVLYRWSQSGPALEYPDEELHWQLARNLIADGAMVSDDGRFAARMPIYPLFLSLFAWMGPIGILAVRLAQAMLGAATVWIVHAFLMKRYGQRVAIVAAVLLCFDPFTVYFSNLLLTEILYIFISISLVLAAWSLATAPDRTTSTAVLGVGLFGAAALMTRPSVAGWVVLLWIVLWLCDPCRGRAGRRVVVWMVVLTLGLTTWGLRNIRVLGAPAWLSANGGVTLYDAQGPQADGSSNQAFMSQLPELAGQNEIERDAILRKLALRQMREHPDRAVRLAWTKFLRTWSLVPNVAEHRDGLTALISAIFTMVVIVAAFCGLMRAVRCSPELRYTPEQRRGLRRLHLLLWAPIIYFTLVHCVFIGSLRYRVPLMPLLEIAASAAFVRPDSTLRVDEAP